jgi:hypothetical protein
MADSVAVRQLASPQVLQNLNGNKCYDCINCTLLERELKKVRDEITSYQLIVELLHKEIKDTETEKRQRSTNTALHESIAEEIVKPDKNWSQIITKVSNNNKRGNATNKYHQAYPISTGNRYSALLNITETSASSEDSNPIRSSRTSQPDLNRFFKKKDTKKEVNPARTRYRGDTKIESPPKQTRLSEVECDSGIHDIPTIVNGQINQITKNNVSSEQNDIQTLLSETTVRLINKRTNYAKYCKHRVMIIGDSHLKGCASRVISSLDTRFNVCAFLKPGSSSLTLMETTKSDIDKLTKDDFLIVCSGANDIYKNSSNDALKNIIKFIKSVNNTNIILVCVPHRFDLSNNSDTNDRINLHNGKLMNLPKTFNYVNTIEPVSKDSYSRTMDCI